MTREDFQHIIDDYIARKKANPYFDVNYKTPLKGKEILERLKKHYESNKQTDRFYFC